MVVVIFSAQPWQMQLKSYTVAGGLPLYIRFFVHQIKDDTPIFNRQVTKEKGLHVLYTTVGSPCMLYHVK